MLRGQRDFNNFDTFVSKNLQNLVYVYIFGNNDLFNWSVYPKFRFIFQLELNDR